MKLAALLAALLLLAAAAAPSAAQPAADKAPGAESGGGKPPADASTAKATKPSATADDAGPNTTPQKPPPAPAKADAETAADSPWSPATIRDLKRTVVSIDEARPVALTDDKRGAAQGTGFVVDADAGLVVTNRHISTVSPAIYRLRFFDGSVAPAKVLYYDVSQDFAILKFNRSDTTFNVTAVTLGNSSTVHAGDPILIIGNNEGYVFSAIEGVVSDVRVISDTPGTRPSIDIETTTDSGGGSSGSPVWNAESQVVAVNYAGDSTSARVVPINYVLNILNQIKAGTRIARGDAGLLATLVPAGDAVRHYKLPKDAAAAAGAARGDIGGVPKVILVTALNPRAPAAGAVKPGDIIFAADGVPLADDLAALDRAMDAHVGDTVPITLYRNGQKLDVAMPTHDLEKTKTKKFARFAGGTFQDLSERTLLFTPVSGVDGVLLAYTDEGTTLGTAVPPRAVVTALNGIPTPTLDAFIAAASTIKHGDAGTVQYASSRYPTDPGVTEVTFDTRFTPLEVYAFDDGAHEWVKEI